MEELIEYLYKEATRIQDAGEKENGIRKWLVSKGKAEGYREIAKLLELDYLNK